MQTSEFKPWEELYVAAVLEDDPAKAADRITLRRMPFASDGVH